MYKRQHQNHGGDERELHVLDAGADGLGAVGSDGDLDVGRQAGDELRKQLLDPVHRADHISPGLPLNCENDRGFVVIPAVQAHVLGGNGRMTDVTEPDRCSVAIGDDQVVISVSGQNLVVGRECIGLRIAVEDSFRLVDGEVTYRPAQLLEVEPCGRKLGRIDLDADRRLLHAADGDERHAWHL